MNKLTVHFQARSRPIDEAAQNRKQLKSIPKRISHEDFIRLSAELSEMAGPQPHDSAELIREDRDR